MDTNDLIFTLLIGAVSGWLAGQIRRGYGFGLIGNIMSVSSVHSLADGFFARYCTLIWVVVYWVS